MGRGSLLHCTRKALLCNVSPAHIKTASARLHNTTLYLLFLAFCVRAQSVTARTVHTRANAHRIQKKAYYSLNCGNISLNSGFRTPEPCGSPYSMMIVPIVISHGDYSSGGNFPRNPLINSVSE